MYCKEVSKMCSLYVCPGFEKWRLVWPKLSFHFSRFPLFFLGKYITVSSPLAPSEGLILRVQNLRLLYSLSENVVVAALILTGEFGTEKQWLIRVSKQCKCIFPPLIRLPSLYFPAHISPTYLFFHPSFWFHEQICSTKSKVRSRILWIIDLPPVALYPLRIQPFLLAPLLLGIKLDNCVTWENHMA